MLLIWLIENWNHKSDSIGLLFNKIQYNGHFIYIRPAIESILPDVHDGIPLVCLSYSWSGMQIFKQYIIFMFCHLLTPYPYLFEFRQYAGRIQRFCRQWRKKSNNSWSARYTICSEHNSDHFLQAMSAVLSNFSTSVCA